MKTFSVIFFLSLISVSVAYSQNNPPVAINDTVYGFYNYPVQVHILQNDYDPDGDSIYVYQNSSALKKINDSTWELLIIRERTNYITSIEVFYRIKDMNGSSAGAVVVFTLKSPLSYDSLDINNINAVISPFGFHFCDLEQAHFKVPKGSGEKAVFNHTLWVGGFDPSAQLHLTAERANQRGGFDCSEGPITIVRDSAFDKKWNRVWKVNKKQIQYHIANWNNSGYQPIDVIKNWPAHGDVLLGQTENIAPFYNRDGNGKYDPLSGDYPLIRGDQTIFFIFNDSSILYPLSFTNRLGIEIHGMAYAFDKPSDSLLYNSIFFHYDILNHSLLDYHDGYIGLFSEFDLGNPADDYIGSDVTNGMIYVYNGDAFDEDTSYFYTYDSPMGYGEHPPALGLKVIGGPYLPEDGIDNPAGICDFSINGLNFGDNIVDNERLGMTNSIYPIGNNLGYWNPEIAINYYNFMRSIWMDGAKLMFAGPNVGPECEYIFPSNSDSLCNWGTHGIPPNGGYNQNGIFWTESEVNNVPGDRRGLASIGPFTMNAGQSIPLDYCFTFARDYTGDHMSSVELLRERVSTIQSHASDLISLPLTYYSIQEKPKPSRLNLLPNPAQNWIIVVSEEKSSQPYQIFDFSGKLVSEGLLQEGNNQLNIRHLKQGVYLLKSGMRWGRFVKI